MISTKDIPRLDVSASSDSFRKFRRDFLNMLCATTDTQGFSVSEHLVGTDQGAGLRRTPSMAPPPSSARKRPPSELASSMAGASS